MSFSEIKESDYMGETFREIHLKNNKMKNKFFEDCVFIKCDFSETDFQGCIFRYCSFQDCNLSLVKVTNSKFSNTVFENSKVIGVNWTQASWKNIELHCPVNFIKCIINHSTFLGLSLREMKVKDCISRDVDFRESDLTRADFTDSDLENSLFIGTDLTDADFCNSRSYRIDVALNKVKGAKFSLPEAISLLYYLEIDLLD